MAMKLSLVDFERVAASMTVQQVALLRDALDARQSGDWDRLASIVRRIPDDDLDAVSKAIDRLIEMAKARR